MTKSLTTRAYEIVQDLMESNEDQVMTKIKEEWPVEYAAAVEASMIEDRSLDEDHVPNLSFVCEQVKDKDEDKFLSFLAKIWI
jgi:hypothetical protein